MRELASKSPSHQPSNYIYYLPLSHYCTSGCGDWQAGKKLIQRDQARRRNFQLPVRLCLAPRRNPSAVNLLQSLNGVWEEGHARDRLAACCLKSRHGASLPLCKQVSPPARQSSTFSHLHPSMWPLSISALPYQHCLLLNSQMDPWDTHSFPMSNSCLVSAGLPHALLQCPHVCGNTVLIDCTVLGLASEEQ